MDDTKKYYNGNEYNTIAELARDNNISAAALSRRLREKENLQEAVDILKRKSKPLIVKGEKFNSLAEIAYYYKIKSHTLRHRVKKLKMSFEEAIDLPVKKLKSGVVVVEGKTYRSFATAAKAYGLNPEPLRYRLGIGMTAEEAILKPNLRTRSIEFLGRKFNSINAFAKYHKIKLQTVRSRLRSGWSLEDIIHKPIMKNNIVIYKGKTYSSILDMCNKLKKPYKLIYKRIKTFGWSVEKAIETPKLVGKEIFVRGKVFSSQSAAANFYKIDKGLFQYRLAAGWDIDKAIDPDAEVSNRKSIKIDGEEFNTYSEAARFYNLNENTFMRRLKTGWSAEQAAGIDEPPVKDMSHTEVNPEDYRERLHKIHGDNLDFSLSKFKKAQTKIEVICTHGKDHPTFWATPNNLLGGKGCPICKLSHGARKVSRWLDKNNIKYEVEWTGHGLRSEIYEKATLRMDFHIPLHKTVIEFDGPQHEEPLTLGRMSEEEAMKAFKQTQRNDKRKNDWAKSSGYKMIRIKHNEHVSKRLEKEFKLL